MVPQEKEAELWSILGSKPREWLPSPQPFFQPAWPRWVRRACTCAVIQPGDTTCGEKEERPEKSQEPGGNRL